MIYAVNTGEENIVTIEDPIEKDIPGVNQSSINPRRGWDFENCLASYLRQDPDIIFVGEIRNGQTSPISGRVSFLERSLHSAHCVALL